MEAGSTGYRLISGLMRRKLMKRMGSLSVKAPVLLSGFILLICIKVMIPIKRCAVTGVNGRE